MRYIKPLVFMVCLAMVFSLVGCGAATSKDVLAQAANKTKDMKNFTAKMSTDINMTSNKESQSMKMDADMMVDVKPMNAYVKMNLGTSGTNLDMEYYLKDDTAYMKVSTVPQWIKVTNAKKLTFTQTNQNTNPYDSLKQMEKYADKVDLKETDQGYVLKVTSTKGKMNNFLKEYSKKMIPSGQNKQLAEEFKNMTIDSMDYTTVIDKKTYFPKTVNMKMVATVKDTDGSPVHVVVKLDSTYSDFNKTKVKSVSDDIKNNAIEVSADQLNGM